MDFMMSWHKNLFDLLARIEFFSICLSRSIESFHLQFSCWNRHIYTCIYFFCPFDLMSLDEVDATKQPASLICISLLTPPNPMSILGRQASGNPEGITYYYLFQLGDELLKVSNSSGLYSNSSCKKSEFFKIAKLHRSWQFCEISKVLSFFPCCLSSFCRITIWLCWPRLVRSGRWTFPLLLAREAHRIGPGGFDFW